MYWNRKVDSILGRTLQNNTDYIRKSFKQKWFKMKFPTKNSLDAYLYFT